MLRIDAAQQFALVEPEGDAVISLPSARFPHGFLTGQHDCQAIEVDSLLALLRELRREYGRHDGQQESDHRLVIAQPSAADWTVPSRPELRERRGHVRDVRRQQRVDAQLSASEHHMCRSYGGNVAKALAVGHPHRRTRSQFKRRGLSDAVRHGLAAKPTECFHAARLRSGSATSPCGWPKAIDSNDDPHRGGEREGIGQEVHP